MKGPSLAALALWVFALLLTFAGITASDGIGCTGTAVFDAGNWYCSNVSRITYQDVGGDSFYPLVTLMDNNTGECANVSQPFTGKMSPLDEDVSVHFRGPLILKQFAVYVPASQPVKRHADHQHGHRHAHDKLGRGAQKHGHLAHVNERDVGDWVTATIDGQVASWINEYDGEVACAVPVTATIDGNVESWTNDYCGPSIAAATTSTLSSSVAVVASVTVSSAPSSTPGLLPGEILGNGTWTRIAYYNSDNQAASGLVFLNNNGGNNGSGEWDPFFGNSLSFANEDSTDGSPRPVMFSGTLVKNWEVAIFSDQNCTEDTCSYWRPGSVAYNGFAGSEKAFFMEFQMPDDGDNTPDHNMPAIWFLNGKIPRTEQYGSCSCWPPCGEFDAFEVLTPGYTQMKATLHGNISGGISDYFDRPVDAMMTGAVLFNDNNIIVQVLNDEFDFGDTVSLEHINELTNGRPGDEGTDWLLTS